MHINDVIKKCSDEGYPISRMGLYTAGKKEGFIIKCENKKELDFDKNKFLQWLKKAKGKAPEGWVKIKDLPNIFGISLTQCYILSKDEESGAKTFGSGKGVIYVDPERIAKIIKKRKDKYKINWEE